MSMMPWRKVATQVIEPDLSAPLYKAYDKFNDEGIQTQFTIARPEAHGVKARDLTIDHVGPETREERIKRLEASGTLDPKCRACDEFYMHPTLNPFAPRHNSKDGHYPHCTCDACF